MYQELADLLSSLQGNPDFSKSVAVRAAAIGKIEAADWPCAVSVVLYSVVGELRYIAEVYSQGEGR